MVKSGHPVMLNSAQIERNIHWLLHHDSAPARLSTSL